MKLILFGGADGRAVEEIKLIGQVINRIKPKQVLHVPFARTSSSQADWSGDWFNRNIILDETIYLNAANEGDIAQADRPLIFISGGSEHISLYNKITSTPRLLQLVTTAEYIIGESAGSMALGEYQWSGKLDGPLKLMKGLGIIKNTIIVPHYTERNLQGKLKQGMKESGLKYGLGIDSMTAIEFELDEFPEKYNKIGDGSIFIETSG